MESEKNIVVDTTLRHDGTPEASVTLRPASEAGLTQIRLKAAPDCIPIFPMRYGWVDKAHNQALTPDVVLNTYPQPPTAQDSDQQKHWGLRLLRPHSFVYMAYTHQGEKKLQGFQIEKDGRFTALPCALTGECEVKVATLPYLPAPAQHVEKVHLFVVDTKLTAKKVNEVLSGTVDAGYNTFANWLDTYATPVLLDTAITQPHTFKTHLLPAVSPELARNDQQRLTSLLWSESLVASVSGDDIITGMGKVKGSEPHSPGIAVVLADPVGAISEANFALENVYANISDWAEENSYKQFSAEVIESLVENARREKERKARQSDPILGASGSATGGAVLKAHKNVELAGEATAEELRQFYQYDAMHTWLNKTYPTERKRLEDAIESALTQLDELFDALQQPYEASLALYDVLDVEAYQDLRMVASHTLSGLAHCQRGSEWLIEQLPATGPEGLMGQVLCGHPLVKRTIMEVLNLLASAGEAVAEAHAKRLVDTFKTVHSDTHAKQLSIMISLLARRGKLADATAFMQSPYRVVMELLDGEIIHHQRITKAELPAYLSKQMQLRGIKDFTFSGATLSKSYRQMLNLWESEDLTQTFAKELAAEKSLTQKVRFWGNANVGFSGTATLLSLFNVESTLSELSQEDGIIFTNVLAASGALVGFGAGVAGLSEVVHLRAQRLAAMAGDARQAEAMRQGALRAEKVFIGFMTATASLMAVKNAVEGMKAKGDAKALHFGITSVQSIIAASGFLYFAKNNRGQFGSFYRRAFSRLESGGATSQRVARRLTRFSTPKAGWLLLASTATTALEFYLTSHNEKSKITDWIAKSAWGTQRSLGRFYDDYSLTPFKDEDAARLAIYRLHHSPIVRIEKNYFNRDEVVIHLPNYQSQVSGYEIKQLIMRPFASVEQAYKNVKTQDLPKAKPITVNLEGGMGVIRFPTITRGKVYVRYWPNGFTQPDLMLTGESE